MNARYASRREGSRSGARSWRISRRPPCQDSAPIRLVFNAFIILAILIAVATALIAPSIDMPDTVLREHHFASHSAGGPTSGTLVSSGMSPGFWTGSDEGVSRPAETRRSPHLAYDQSSVIMRC